MRRWVGRSPFYDLVKRILLLEFIAATPLILLVAGGYSSALPQPYRPLFWVVFFGLLAGPTYALLHKRLKEETELDDKRFGKSQKEAQARWIARHEGEDA